MKAGDALVMFYTSANRDEAVFDDPMTFDITREPVHVGFGGGGPHFCLGAHLARRNGCREGPIAACRRARLVIIFTSVTRHPPVSPLFSSHGIRNHAPSWRDQGHPAS